MATFWTGYELKDFLFENFDITKCSEFTGVLVGLVAIAIGYEGIRTLRDFTFSRFITTTKGSRIQQRSKSSTPPSVRYNRAPGEDEAEQERLTGNDNNRGAGDAPASTVHSHSSFSGIQREEEDEDVLIHGDGNRRVIGSPVTSPYRDTTFPTIQTVSNKRRWELLDLTLSTIFHMAYITVGYVLMLAVMTFNTYILIAVTSGIAVGFYIFGPVRNSREFAIFKLFESKDPCEERLLPSHDQSKTESSSGGSGQIPAHVSGSGDHCASSSGVVVGVQVHHTDQ